MHEHDQQKLLSCSFMTS